MRKINPQPTLPLVIFLVLISLINVCCGSSPSDDPAHPEPGAIEEPERVEGPSLMSVNVEYEGIIPKIVDGVETDNPEYVLFTVEVENPEALGVESYNVNFIYKALVPTGEVTYLRENPKDKKSPFKSDENGPVLYRVVEPVAGKLESLCDTSDNTPSFAVMPPDNTVVIEYSVEIVVLTEQGEEKISETPYTTLDQVFAQGGILTEEDEEV